MKKVLFFAALCVAVMLTSCGKDGEKPKAVFTYEVSDLTVTFTNMSKDADSYVWEFGDGETSTEKDPVHTYAAADDYSVTLKAINEAGEGVFTEVVSVKAAGAIKIDGEFADWDALEAEGKSTIAKLEDGLTYEKDALTKMACYTDADFIYLYFEFDATRVAPIDIVIATQMITDESHLTHLWDPCYCDYLLECGDEASGDWTQWSTQTLFGYDHSVGGWAFLEDPVATNCADFARDGKGKAEFRLSRAYMSFAYDYINVACFVSTADWDECGALPGAVVSEEDGSIVYPEMMKVMLNN